MKKIIFFLLFIFFLIAILNVSLAIEKCFCNSGSFFYSDSGTRKTIKDDASIDYSLYGLARCDSIYNACYDTNRVETHYYFCLEQLLPGTNLFSFAIKKNILKVVEKIKVDYQVVFKKESYYLVIS